MSSRPPSARRFAVLVCDDDADVRRMLFLVLGGRYEVVQAADGLEALETIDGKEIDLVIIDACMPRMSGLAALRAYRQTHPHIATIMLTGRREMHIAKRALDLGAAEYVTKPVDADYIRLAVRRLLDAAEPRGGDPLGRPWRVRGS